MKLSDIFEMAKRSKTRRKNEAKRARKDKVEKPTEDKASNLAAKFAQTSGAGAHKTKKKYSKDSRKEAKKELRDY